MPPIYRHVVPNVPAWTAGNGKPIYRGNAPSYRRNMVFSASWSGSISVAGSPRLQGFVPIDPTVTAAEMNALLQSSPLATTPFDYGTAYNDFSSYPEYFEYVRTYPTTFLEVPGVKRIGMRVSIGIEWSASLSYWRWTATLFQLSVRCYDANGAYADVPTCSVANGLPWFKGAAETTVIRAGNGRTLPFAAWTDIDPGDSWRANIMTGCALAITTHYA